MECIQGSFGLKGGKVGEQKMVGGWKSEKERKDFNFPHYCLIRSEKMKEWKK